MSIAAMGFFVLACVGWASDVPVFVCGMRALVGAAGLYVLINLGGAAAIRILVSAAMEVSADERSTRKSKP